MNFRYLTLIGLFLSSIASGANAAVPEGTVISNDEMHSLASWVEKKTHISMQVLPVATASNRSLGIALRIDDVQRAGAMAAYLPGRLYISNTIWDPNSLRMQSYIVHELVHHAQFVSGKTYPCHAAKEREAYTLQNQWLIEHGLEPIATPQWIDSHSVCDGHDHDFDGD